MEPALQQLAEMVHLHSTLYIVLTVRDGSVTVGFTERHNTADVLNVHTERELLLCCAVCSVHCSCELCPVSCEVPLWKHLTT